MTRPPGYIEIDRDNEEGIIYYRPSPTLAESFASGSYTNEEEEYLPGQAARFNQIFHFVDGVRYPLSLICPDLVDLDHRRQFELLGNPNCNVQGTSVVSFAAGRAMANLRAPYNISRSVNGGGDPNDSYMRRIFGNETKCREVLSKLREDMGDRALRVLDPGCGLGFALDEFCEEFPEYVDGEHSYGLSLPLPVDLDIVSDKVVFANIMHCGAKTRFDILMSVHGAFTYHPFNQYKQAHVGIMGLLQAVSMTKIRGLLALVPSIGFDALLEREIVEWVPDTAAYRVLRHPELDEIIDICRYEEPLFGIGIS